MTKGKLPDFKYEKILYRQGFKYIAGVDEVGKGCFAGPLVTGCVIFSELKTGPVGSSSRSTILGLRLPAGAQRDSLRSRHPFAIPDDVLINDSKQMRPRQREKSAIWIKENALAWGIGEVSAQKINHIGMSKAAKMCFRQAISEARKSLGKPIDFLLADAFFISYVPGLPARRASRQQAIVGGDQKSISIAAASIIAKVYRDKLMQDLSKRPKYRKYGWGRNKGYGTKEHRSAIKKYGITRQHRKMWVETWEKNSRISELQI